MSQVFSFHDHPVRTITENGQPWFAGSDIAKLLGYARPEKEVRRICKHVKLFKPTNLVGWGNSPRGFLIIPEADVWRLIVRSTLDKAQEIEEWIMSEVLPVIRRTGKYEPTPKALPKHKALPAPASKPKSRLPLPHPFPKERIDVLLAHVGVLMLEIADCEKQVTDILTHELIKVRREDGDPIKGFILNASCSQRTLWSSLDFGLKAIRSSTQVVLAASRM